MERREVVKRVLNPRWGIKKRCPDVRSVSILIIQEIPDRSREDSGVNTPAPRHRTAFRNIIPLPASQGLAAEVPAGGGPLLVNGTAPFPDSAAIRLIFAQVLARGVNKEVTVRFLQPPLAEVMQLVGFALPDGDEREPAAALATVAAGAGYRVWL